MKRLKRQQRRILVSLVNNAALVQAAILRANESAAQYLCMRRPDFTIGAARRAIARQISEDEKSRSLKRTNFYTCSKYAL